MTIEHDKSDECSVNGCDIPEHLAPEPTAVRFTMADGERVFDGWSLGGETWNGWDVVSVDRDVLDALIVFCAVPETLCCVHRRSEHPQDLACRLCSCLEYSDGASMLTTIPQSTVDGRYSLHGYCTSLETQEMRYERAIAYGVRIGRRHGLSAASWYFDGNTTHATYRAVLKGLDDGDPAVMDTFPAADLSGEWADATTGPMLYRDACEDAGLDHEDSTVFDAVFSDLCDAYEQAFSEASSQEIERVAHYHTDEED